MRLVTFAAAGRQDPFSRHARLRRERRRGDGCGPIYPGDVIESEIEGIGILRNAVESVRADPIYAQPIGL